jgi:glucosamine-phosphate N-acetyltransferase
MENFYIKEISDEEDHFNDYFDLMYEFSNYKKDVSYDYFKNYIKQNDKIKIIIIHNNKNKIIGAGTIFKLEKLHNNPIGQIEDVIISEKYRGLGLGKKIIKELVKIGIEDFKCYKVILNCLDKNIGFYEKSSFEIAGVEMKYIK